MFVDMRGSTRLAERRLPYDTVFLINQFLNAVSSAVVEAGGQPNQVLGDGLLAVFGLTSDPDEACRAAVAACGRRFGQGRRAQRRAGAGAGRAGPVRDRRQRRRRDRRRDRLRAARPVHRDRRRGQRRRPPAGPDARVRLRGSDLGGGFPKGRPRRPTPCPPTRSMRAGATGRSRCARRSGRRISAPS